MKRINILDCTLRDGGYVNDFNFGERVIKSIVNKLSRASIDIIECGFLKSRAFNRDQSLFGSVEALRDVIGKKNPNLLYVAMIQYGSIGIDEISECDGTSIDGVRVTFHEHEIDSAFELGKRLMGKGYKVFMQPVGTTTYTDDALLRLIKRVNILRPFAFYLVDTLGVMYKNDLLRMFYLVDHNLDKRIALGFHSHNNLQLSFANAQELIQLNTTRRLIIDASVLGIGRGAGNLNTELATQFINSNFDLQYDNLEILEILDEYIKPIRNQFVWGYDAPYYIASINGCHPNYASYLINRQTLQARDIQAILCQMAEDKRTLFDEEYIAQEYYKYQNHHIDDTEAQQAIRRLIGNKKIMLLAPGKSLTDNVAIIGDTIKRDDYFVISVNFIPKDFRIDAVFTSNIRRFANARDLSRQAGRKCTVIITSNINHYNLSGIIVVNYSSYTNEESIIVDNAGLMCVNLMKKIGVDSVVLAGFDGFSQNMKDNYYESSLWVDVGTERLMRMNVATSKKLAQLSKQIKIAYLTSSKYRNELTSEL